MSIPGTSTDVECHCISDFLWQGLEDPELCEDVVGGILQVVLDLDVKVQLEIKFQAKLYQELKCLEVATSKSMLSGPHEDSSLSCCQPPGMAEGATLDLLKLLGQYVRFQFLD